MKSRPRLTLVILFLATFAVGFAWFYRYEYYDPIRYENYERIQDGMSRTEVHALLGCTPGRYPERMTDLHLSSSYWQKLGITEK